MKILFYNKVTREIVNDDMLFVKADGTVWRDNGYTWESQSSVIGFDDCVESCPHIGWDVDHTPTIG